LIEGDALVGAMVLRKAEDALGDRVEQCFVRPARDAACRRVDPTRPPIVLGRGMFVEREGVGPLKVERQFGELRARARSEASRDGKEWYRPGRSGGWPCNK